jgi:hypothetical protein
LACGYIVEVIGPLIRGALAGAAGTTALNAVTYADMAARGRPASELPQRAVEKMADDTGTGIPGDDEQRQNRVDGLGPLLGLATGVGVGVAAGLLRPLLVRVPGWVCGPLVGAVAMALTDGPMKRLGLTAPQDWSATDWASDAVPHLAYGAVTVATLRRLGG